MDEVEEASTSAESHKLIGSTRLFRNRRAHDDCSITYLTLAQTLAAQASTVVEVGCGRGAAMDDPAGGPALQDLRGAGRTVIGIDIEPVAAENPMIDEFRQVPADGSWPLETGAVDLVASDWTLEHVTDPGLFVSELTRVLRPGGAFVARTVSRWSALAIAARLVPNKSHARVIDKLQPDRSECDVFPTVYRMNTRRALRSLLDPGFDWMTIAKPGLENYFDPWPRLGRFVAFVERRLPRSAQMVLIVTARRRPDPGVGVAAATLTSDR
jgi:SAM-dependent methyltransferase